jgi:hypothetical protein
MIECKCGQKVKTKFCPQCGAECNGDSDILKWIAECENNLRYWDKKETSNPSDGTGDLKLGKKCQAMKKMWKRRIELLKQVNAEKGE